MSKANAPLVDAKVWLGTQPTVPLAYPLMPLAL